MKIMSNVQRRKIIDALNHISADCDYQTWIRVGMSIASFGPAGFNLWNQWSSTASGRYPGEADLRKRFAGFKSNKVTLGTLFFFAKQSGHVPAPGGADAIVGATASASADASLQPAESGESKAIQQEQNVKKARTIWTDGWQCTSIDEVYSGILLESTENTDQRGNLRSRMHSIRDAAYAYLKSRGLDQRWLLELRICILNTREKDDYAMSKKGAIGFIAAPMANNGVISGIQRTYLDAAGRKVHRMMLGRLGVMNISPLAAAPAIQAQSNKSLLLWGEGFETCAHSAESSGNPCTVLFTADQITSRARMYLEQSATATAEQLAASPAIGLLVDRDISNTGQNACFQAVQMLRKAGLDAFYLLPPEAVKGGEKGADWADVAQELGHAAAGKALQLAMQNQPFIPELKLKDATSDRADHQADADSADWIDVSDIDSDAYADQQSDYEAYEASLIENAVAPSVRRQNWRKAAEDPAAGHASNVVIHDPEAGRKIMKAGMQRLVDDYVGWLDEWRTAKKEAKENGGIMQIPEFSPYLFRPSTGAGKSTELKALPNNPIIIEAGGAVRVAVATHSECKAYCDESPLYSQYHGRSEDQTSPGFCVNYQEMMKAVEAGHIPQAEFCFTCKNGLKWSVEHHGKATQQGQKSLEKLEKMGITGKDFDALEACVWQDHKIQSRKERFLVYTHHSHSDNLAEWDSPAGVVPALLNFDEDVPFAATIEKITVEKVSEWARRNASNVRYLEFAIEHGYGNAAENRWLLAKAENSQELIVEFGKEIAGMGGKSGRICKDSRLWHYAHELISEDGSGSVADWERLEFERGGDLSATPLRGAYAIAQTLRFNDSLIENGALHVSAVRPVIERMGKLPTALFNATPSPVDEAVIRARRGIVIDVTIRQHVKIIRRTNRFWGLKALKIGSVDPKRLRAEMTKYERLIEHFGDRRFIVHMAARDLMDPERLNEGVEHWGGGHRAHNRFEGKSMAIAGSFFIPASYIRHHYQSHRLAALTAGADPLAWPIFDDEDLYIDESGVTRDRAFQYDESWVNEGSGVEVRCLLPLPVQPHIRSWFLKLCTIETVQAIGRARGVNASADAPLDIDIFGGVPLFALETHGLTIAEYLDDPETFGMTVAERNRERHETVVGELNTAALKILAGGGEIGRKSIDEQVRIDRAEVIENAKNPETEGVCTVSVYKPITMTVQTPFADAPGIHPDVYKHWLKSIGMPLFADAMAVNGRSAAAVRAAKAVIANHPPANADAILESLEAWAKSATDDGLPLDEAAANDVNIPEYRGVAKFYDLAIVHDDVEAAAVAFAARRKTTSRRGGH
jgi:hypothetical protein